MSTTPASQVLAAAKDMLRRGLVEGTAGNISARQRDGTVVITPSAVDYADMQLDDLVVVDARRRDPGTCKRRPVALVGAACSTWPAIRLSTTSAR